MSLDQLAYHDPASNAGAAASAPGWIDQVGAFWHNYGPEVFRAAVALTALLIVALIVAGRIARSLRNSGAAKLAVGTAVVQAGVTWAVVTGTYVACTRLLHVGRIEAVAFAVFFEAATWVAIGMIRAHAKAGGIGFGAAGPFFWLFSAAGGLLAVIGGDTTGAMVGRAVIVVIGACLWYLQILRWVKRSDKPGRFLWTPHRLLVAIGAIEPGDHDVRDENREWQIRRLARAMRWANGGRPWSWLGQRALIRRGETTHEDVIADARRRYAVAHLLTSSVRPDSPVMQRIIADAQAEVTRNANETERVRLEAEHLAEQLEAERMERVALQRRCDEAEQALRATEALLLRLQSEPATRNEQGERAKQSGASRSKQAKQPAATNAPKMSDDEAVRAMCNAHPERGYAWTKREVYRLTGAGFNRIDKLLEAWAEHRRSTPRCDCAEHSDGDDAKEQSA